MTNLLQGTVTVVGTRPLWWHKFGPDALPLTKGERTGVAGNDPEEWRKTVLVTHDGQLYVEPSYIFGCVRDGSRYTKKGRGSIQTLVAATLQIVDTRILIDRWMPGFPATGAFNLATAQPPPTDPELPVYLDIRGVRNPSTKARNVRYRVAASPGWKCTFTLEWDKTVVNRTQMESALIDAGKLCGIGNGRAIGMGRFAVVEFAVADSE